jgi:hypothetical protein
MHDRPEPGGAPPASAPSVLGEPSGPASSASAEQSAGPVDGAVTTVPTEGSVPANSGPEGPNGTGVGKPPGRRLSRKSSRVLQWIMRDDGRALDTQDLWETLDVDNLDKLESLVTQVLLGEKTLNPNPKTLYSRQQLGQACEPCDPGASGGETLNPTLNP